MDPAKLVGTQIRLAYIFIQTPLINFVHKGITSICSIRILNKC